MQLHFDNTFSRELPADADSENRRRQVQRAAYSRVQPTPVPKPHVVAVSKEMLALLGLSEADAATPEFAEVFGGNRVLPGMEPIAACYGGHQFGNWAGQLGDGRAISLGEVIDQEGRRQELQLKGAGPTPYSRMGDGRAVMRSSVREFLCSEAMHHLGVPTTRALSLVGTGALIERDMLYDGNPRLEPGAVVCRVAPSFLRFGNYQIFASRDDTDTLRRLTDYTLQRHFTHLLPANGSVQADAYVRWFSEVAERTAELIAAWMRVGFVHGVLNTDNMSVLGLTIDYGPYGWLDDYDPNWTPNTTDAGGRRYRFGWQPRIAGWNLARFAEALLPLVGKAPPLETALEGYGHRFEQAMRRVQREKLGLLDETSEAPSDTPEALYDALEEQLTATEVDMTIFFRQLATLDCSAEALHDASDEALVAPLSPAYYEAPSDDLVRGIAGWARRYIRRVIDDGRPSSARIHVMNRTNPKYVLRNYLAQLAIDDAEKGDFERVNEQLDVLRRPYDEQPGKEAYADKRPDWARSRPGCSMLSCSS